MKVKRKVKAIYKIEMVCDKCGRPMCDTGRVALTYPAKRIYECADCNDSAYLREGEEYEIEFEEEDAVICTTLLP